MNVRVATDADGELWDKYLDSAPSTAPLNRFAWKNILERSYKVRTCFLMACNDDGAVCGVLPTYAVRDLAGAVRYYSLRFGLVADDDGVANALISELGDRCRRERADSVLVTSGYVRRETPLPEIRKTTMVMELEGTEEAQWETLRSKTRNMIRKGAASHLVIERGIHNLPQFYDVYCTAMLRKGIPILSPQFFATVTEILGTASELIVAKKDCRVLGGILVLFSKDVAIYPWQCSLPEFQKYAPNQALVWAAIKSCIERRIFKLDMGESTMGGSVYLFKKNFGGTDQDIFYYSSHLLEDVPANRKRKRNLIRRAARFITSYISGILAERSPMWIRKRVSRWVKSRGRIV